MSKSLNLSVPAYLPIVNIPKGEYFKRQDSTNVVYVRGDYDRATNKFSAHKADDMNCEVFFKPTCPVWVGFTY